MAATLLVPQVAQLIERPLAFFSRFRPRGVAAASSSARPGARLRPLRRTRCSPRSPSLPRRDHVGFRAIVLTLAYSVGAAIPMLVIARGGREASARLRSHAETLRLGSGVLIGAVALALTFHLDDRIAQFTPGYTTFLQDKIEKNSTANQGAWQGAWRQAGPRCRARTRRLEPSRLRRRACAPRRRSVDQLAAAHVAATARQGRADRLLDLLVHQLPADAPASEGVVCRVPREGLEIIGVHTPEFAFEHVRRTCGGGEATSASRGRSCRTTVTRPGTTTQTSTGPRSI